MADGICTWTREINLGGPRSAPDVGRLDWVDAPRQLLETGVHADYSELWTRPAATVPQSRRFSAPGRQLFVVWSKTDFAFGIGDADVALRADLAAALAAGSVGLPDLTRHYATEYAIGHWRDDVAEVRASTHPLRRAGGLFDRSALATEVLALHHPDATGQLASCLWTAANQR